MRLDQAGTLERGEKTIDVERAGLHAAPGALLVTDQRLLFFSSSPVRRHKSSVAVPLGQVESVEAAERRSPIRRKGIVRVRVAHDETEYVFEHIPGGLVRAEELRGTISLQQAHLLRGGSGVSPAVEPRPDNTSVSGGDLEQQPAIVVGRGVTSYVRKHGGRLFVWGEPIGGFEWIKASTARPAGIDFAYHGNVEAFDLYVQDSIPGAQRLKLARRWLPRPGIVVDTGLVIGP